MGYVKHNAIIVTGYDHDKLKPFWDWCVDLFDGYITTIVDSPANGYVSFFIPTSGSKMGWETNYQWEEKRETFWKKIKEMKLDYMKKNETNLAIWIDAVEIYYGGDDQECRIERSDGDKL